MVRMQIRLDEERPARPGGCRLGASALILIALVAAPAGGEEDAPLGVVFAPGVVSTTDIEDGGGFTPDGRTFFFSRRQGTWGGERGPSALYLARLEDGGWSAPERLPFSGVHDDTDPFLSPDGRRLFFTSDRPAPGKVGEGHDVWVVERGAGGWGEPRHLAEVSSPGTEYSPVTSADGTLYLASTREGGLGQGDLYAAPWTGEGWGEPVNLGPAVNSPTGEWNVFVAPDGEFLVFEASGRPTNRSPSGDLYVSYREEGGWGEAVPLSALNTPESELTARLSPDGGRLYFSRSVREPDGRHHASVFVVEAAAVLPHPAVARSPTR